MVCSLYKRGILVIPLFAHILTAASCITNNIGGGRLGDQLLVYVKAKWFSYYYKTDFVLTPFDGFEQFRFFSSERHILPGVAAKILLDDEKLLLQSQEEQETVLYHVHLHSKSLLWGDWYDHTTWYGCVDDAHFKSHIQDMLQPVANVSLLQLPTDRVTVALHVRRGGGFDKPTLSPSMVQKWWYKLRYIAYADQAAPLKFAPDSFYCTALRMLSEMLNHVPMYVYIFTDDFDPSAIARAYQDALNMPQVTFDFRLTEHGPDQHVVDDIVNMSRFDCLIRPESSFSKVADIMGNHAIILFPHAKRWEGNTLHITHITVMDHGARTIVAV